MTEQMIIRLIEKVFYLYACWCPTREQLKNAIKDMKKEL
jgi:hypothetical protein